MKKRPQVWAHRGPVARHRKIPWRLLHGRSNRCRRIELDVQRTADGILVVTHDETTGRLAGQPGQIAQRTLSSCASSISPHLGQITCGHPATLDEVLDLCRNTRLRINIELKNSEVPYRAWKRKWLTAS
jgi:glycerophosphoryl diester phosphodiesterase